MYAFYICLGYSSKDLMYVTYIHSYKHIYHRYINVKTIPTQMSVHTL